MDKETQYRIKGGDGREYGPISADQVRQWRTEGRLNESSLIQVEGTTEWKLLSTLPEFSQPGNAATPAGTATPPPPLPANAGSAGQLKQGLAITSLVLGILSLPLSLVCVGFFLGIAAVICGHIAHSRVHRSPEQYNGKGLATAGLVTGYLSIAFSLLMLPALLLPALARAKGRAQSINCANNLKQTGLAFKIWAVDHGGQFPFNVSTNQGGTMEFCQAGPDGFDLNAARHFQVLSNELVTTKVLVCPASSRHAAASFELLRPENISYQLCTGTNVSEANPNAVLMVCPVDGNILHCDGSVEMGHKRKR